METVHEVEGDGGDDDQEEKVGTVHEVYLSRASPSCNPETLLS